MRLALSIAAYAAGAFVVGATLLSAVRTVVVPRPEPVRLTGLVFLVLRKLFDLRSLRATTWEVRDRAMEFDETLAQLREAGVTVVDDADEAWRRFAGWRVNYDLALVSLAGLVMAPYAPWSSDRGRVHRPRATARLGSISERIRTRSR